MRRLLPDIKLQSTEAQLEQLLTSTTPRLQALGLLLQVAQVTGKLDRAYSHTKTRSLIRLAQKRSRGLDSTFTIQNSV
jgi:hypothetical protein